jgi:hypothetical protein
MSLEAWIAGKLLIEKDERRFFPRISEIRGVLKPRRKSAGGGRTFFGQLKGKKIIINRFIDL